MGYSNKPKFTDTEYRTIVVLSIKFPRVVDTTKILNLVYKGRGSGNGFFEYKQSVVDIILIVHKLKSTTIDNLRS